MVQAERSPALGVCFEKAGLIPRSSSLNQPIRRFWHPGMSTPGTTPTQPTESHPSFEPHPIQGWTPDFIPYVLQEAVDGSYYDELIPVTGPDGISWSRRLATEEGIFTGISGGSTFAIAMKIAETAPKGSVLLVMLPDTGRALSFDSVV